MIITAMALLFQPHCWSHFKWTGNFFNFSGISTWGGFSVLIQVIRIKSAICLPGRWKADGPPTQNCRECWLGEPYSVPMRSNERGGPHCLALLFPRMRLQSKWETSRPSLQQQNLWNQLIHSILLLEFWPSTIWVLAQKNWILEESILSFSWRELKCVGL